MELIKAQKFSFLLTIIAILVSYVYTFRYAWRPDTKVFPYNEFPAPAISNLINNHTDS